MKVFEIIKIIKAYYILFKIEQSEKKISLHKLYFKKNCNMIHNTSHMI